MTLLRIVLGLRERRFCFRTGSLNATHDAGKVVPAVDDSRVPLPLQTAGIGAQAGLEEKWDGELRREARGGDRGRGPCSGDALRVIDNVNRFTDSYESALV